LIFGYAPGSQFDSFACRYSPEFLDLIRMMSGLCQRGLMYFSGRFGALGVGSGAKATGDDPEATAQNFAARW